MKARPILLQQHEDSVGYLRLVQFIFFGTALLYFGRSLFIPLFFALLIAIVLYPLCKWLEKHKWHRGLAIMVSLLLVAVLFGVLVELLILQINAFRNDVPGLVLKLKPATLQLRVWIEDNLGVGVVAQNQWLQNNLDNLSGNAGTVLKNTLSIAMSAFLSVFLIPIYAALFLYNRSVFVRSLEALAGSRFHDTMGRILNEIIHAYANFIKGTALVYVIVGILNSIGLMALGIEHAILFGMLTAVMTIIPYVGIIVSALLPISIAWITKESIWYPIGVVAIFSFIQYLEANLIFPKVVAAQLKVSTWATLVAILAGGLLWGVAGMILFIPFVGILKIVSGYIPEWKALNILLSR